MKRTIGSLTTLIAAGALAWAMSFGMSATARAQDAPDSQQPMEIPAQYSQPGQPQNGSQQQQAPQNDAGAGRISFLQGDVSTQHSGSSDWAAATLNTPVVNGDHISTGPNARAEIQLDHANILRLSDQTTANVVGMSRNGMQLQIGQGLANYDVLNNNDGNIEIDTPNVAIRPAKGEGSYRILVNSDGETIVDVRKGTAEISTPQGSTRVERDQRITIQGTADNAQYQISGAPGRDDWDRWNADRDHTIESAKSWRNTNPNYTGTQDLDDYGHWSEVPDYGQVWFPSSGPDFAPYRDGRWVYEPYYGWTWVSYEPWGWAPYHYGRWFVYGGNWGWWPGPVYAGYYPLWAPAYVSFFGFGGGFGNVGWLPCGPGDRFFPWYGRGIARVNEANIYNIRNNREGLDPLRGGPHAFSNIDRASSDVRVRSGFSSMQSGQFGHERVPMHQSRIDAATFTKASVMTGRNPVSPSRQSFQPTDRQANPRSIPSSSASNQHFFSSNARPNAGFGGNAGNFNRGGNSTGNPAQSNARGFGSANSPGVNRGPAATESRPSIQSSRPGWHTFTPPSGASSGRQMQSDPGGRTFEGQGQPQGNYSRPQESQRSNQPPNNARGNVNGYGSGRPTLDMHQPVVTPRGGNSYPSRPPNAGRTYSPPPSRGNYGGYGGGNSYPSQPPSRGGSYSAPPARGSYGGNNGGSRPAPQSGGSRAGYSGGGSRGGGNSGGGSHGGSSGGGGNHR